MLPIEVLEPQGDERQWRAVEAVLAEALHPTVWKRPHPISAEALDTVTAARQLSDQLTLFATWCGQPAGVVFAEFREQRTVAFIGWVAVRPAFRRHGIASRLVGELQRKPGLVQMEGMVDREDP